MSLGAGESWGMSMVEVWCGSKGQAQIDYGIDRLDVPARNRSTTVLWGNLGSYPADSWLSLAVSLGEARMLT